MNTPQTQTPENDFPDAIIKSINQTKETFERYVKNMERSSGAQEAEAIAAIFSAADGLTPHSRVLVLQFVTERYSSGDNGLGEWSKFMLENLKQIKTAMQAANQQLISVTPCPHVP